MKSTFPEVVKPRPKQRGFSLGMVNRNIRVSKHIDALKTAKSAETLCLVVNKPDINNILGVA